MPLRPRSRSRCLPPLAVLAVLAAVLGACGGQGAPEERQAAPDRSPVFRPFAADSVWNLPLPDDTPVHRRSDTWVSWLDRTTQEKGAWLNSTSCGMPMFWAKPDERRVPVRLDHPEYMDPALIAAWKAVPVPPDARPADCNDANFAVLQRQPDGRIAAWEFWRAKRDGDGRWSAEWGGAIEDLQADSGIYSGLSWQDPEAKDYLARSSDPTWGVSASSVAMVAGVMTQEALRRRQIDHALSLAVVDTKKGEWLWPAQRTDGGLDDPAALPEGARLRLPANFDVEAVQGPPLVKLLARAAQRYGIVLRDRSFGPTVFYAEDPGKGRPDAVKTLLDGATPGDALKQFPWSELQVVDARTCKDASEPCRRGEERAEIEVPPGAVQAFEPTVLDTGASALDQPRADVRWDLDGDGSYERRAGTAVRMRAEFDGVGEREIGVRIEMRDGDVVTARRTISVE